MRTLLTGATGLIGANLVRALLREGERPRVLLTPGSDGRSLAGLDVERVSGDVRDAHSLAKAISGVHRVFHAAGHVRFDDAGRLLLWNVNVEGTRQVLQAARSAGVRKLVHVSSSVTLAPGTLDRPGTEDGPPPERSTPYAESKRESEEVVGDAAVAVAKLVDRGEHGDWDIGREDDRRTLLEVAQLACELAGADPSSIEVVEPPEGLALVFEGLDTDRLRSIGWRPDVRLEDGMARTLELLR